MPLISYSAEEARMNMKQNHFHRWAMRDKERNEPKNLAVNRVNHGKLNIKVGEPGFQLKGDESVFTIGSCFAREIEDVLVEQGFDVLTRDPAIQESEALRPSAANLRQTAFLNRYNTGSMLEEFRFLLGEGDSKVSLGKLFYNTSGDEWMDLHYSPVFHSKTLEDGVARRKLIRRTLSRLKSADLCILTLGLVEAWYDEVEQAYLNVVPGPRVIKNYSDQLRLNVLSYEENLANLEEIYRLLRMYCRPDLKIIITVSPVPLEATFTQDDVIIANNRSKSILRTAADAFSLKHENVEYFPSYEIANFSNFDDVWEWDGRHVKPSLVKYILYQFQRAYLPQTK